MRKPGRYPISPCQASIVMPRHNWEYFNSKLPTYLLLWDKPKIGLGIWVSLDSSIRKEMFCTVAMFLNLYSTVGAKSIFSPRRKVSNLNLIGISQVLDALEKHRFQHFTQHRQGFFEIKFQQFYNFRFFCSMSAKLQHFCGSFFWRTNSTES